MTATVTPIGVAASRAKHPSMRARRATDPVVLDAMTAQLIASILLDPYAHNDTVIAEAIDLLRGGS
jgi:hypothetical protein